MPRPDGGEGGGAGARRRGALPRCGTALTAGGPAPRSQQPGPQAAWRKKRHAAGADPPQSAARARRCARGPGRRGCGAHAGAAATCAKGGGGAGAGPRYPEAQRAAALSRLEHRAAWGAPRGERASAAGSDDMAGGGAKAALAGERRVPLCAAEGVFACVALAGRARRLRPSARAGCGSAREPAVAARRVQTDCGGRRRRDAFYATPPAGPAANCGGSWRFLRIVFVYFIPLERGLCEAPVERPARPARHVNTASAQAIQFSLAPVKGLRLLSHYCDF